MKVAPNIQMEALLYYMFVKLRSDIELLPRTEQQSPDEIIKSVIRNSPVAMDKNGIPTLNSKLPVLALRPDEISYTTPSGRMLSNTTYKLFYLFERPVDSTYNNNRYSGDEKAALWSTLVHHRLKYQLDLGYLGTWGNKTWKLEEEGKLYSWDLSPCKFVNEYVGRGMFGFMGDLTVKSYWSPYDKLEPDTMSQIKVTLYNGASTDDSLLQHERIAELDDNESR